MNVSLGKLKCCNGNKSERDIILDLETHMQKCEGQVKIIRTGLWGLFIAGSQKLTEAEK